MKVVHLTDIHVHAAPRLRDMRFKRVLGSVNLYMLGRHAKFSPEAQKAAVEATVAEEPGLVIITGDLTGQALEGEFAAARVLLEPILSRFPTVMIAGNHDTYVRERSVGRKMRQHFGEWMGPESPALLRFGEEVAVLTLETCRPHPLSAGFTPPAHLERARELLEDVDDNTFVFLAIHYPLLGRQGQPYGPRSRALSNSAAVIDFIRATDRIDAVLHGHEHHGYRIEIDSAGGPIPILNPGSTGYAWLPDKNRTSHLNIYDVDGSGLNGVRRLTFDGQCFVEEQGGAYATGR